jgi:hypothetical protein
MSRKTAVCLLFVVFLGLAASALPAHVGPPPNGAALSGTAGTYTPSFLPHAPDGDPEGADAAAPALPGGFLLELMRFVVGSLIL